MSQKMQWFHVTPIVLLFLSGFFIGVQIAVICLGLANWANYVILPIWHAIALMSVVHLVHNVKTLLRDRNIWHRLYESEHGRLGR